MGATRKLNKITLMFGAGLLLLGGLSCVLETLPVKATPVIANTPTPTPIFTVTPTNTNMAILVHTATPHPTSETVGKWNLRSCPRTDCEVITVIPDGQLLTIEEDKGDWLRVIYPGYAGWVHRKAIE